MTAGVSIFLVSACSTGEEFVAAFRRYTDRGSLFVPISDPIPAGRRGRFALTLANGGVLVEGEAEVISSSKTPSVLHGRVGMTIRFGDLDDNSKTVLIELEKARLVAKPPAPSVSPRVVELPPGPRPKPPATSVRIDASVALAECTAVGDVEALERTTAVPPKAGPKFVVPSVPAVGAPRAAASVQPVVSRPRTPSGAQPVVGRPKTPSVPPSMPALPRAPSGPVMPSPAVFSATPAPEKPTLSLDPPPPLTASMDVAEGPRTEVMDVPPAPLTPPSMDVVEGPRTEVMDIPPAPLTPSSMDAVGPRTEVMGVPLAPVIATDLADVGRKKPPPNRMLTTVHNASPPPPTPVPPVIGTPAIKPLLETDLEPTDLTTMPILSEDTRSKALDVSAIQDESDADTVRRAPTGDDDAPVEIVGTLPPELDSRPAVIDDADTTTTAQPPEAVQLRAKPPTVEEPTPSGDWTITTGGDAPTIAPRKPLAQELAALPHAPDQPSTPRITGNWTIQLDSTSPDGWSEPSKVDAAALPNSDEKPADQPIEKPKKKRTKPTPETPPELRPIARSIMMEALPAAPEASIASEEPKVQIDPTLMEAPIVDPNYGAPLVMPPAMMPAPVPSISSQLPAVIPQEVPVMSMVQQPIEHLRLATPVPGTMSPMVPIDRPTPSPIKTDPRVTPLPGSLLPQFPPGHRVSPSELGSRPPPPPHLPDLSGRLVTDGGVGFFRDSGEIVNVSSSGSFPVGSSSLVDARRRRRLVVIGISAGIVVALGIALVIMVAGGDKKSDDPSAPHDAVSVKTDPADAPPKVAITPADAGVEAPPKDAAVVAPPKQPECTVAVTTVPPGAEVLVQGSVDILGTSPVKIPLPCGLEVRLLVRKQRFGNVIRIVTPTEEGVSVRVTLGKLVYSVKVSSTPAGATISLNGKSVAVTPTTMKLPAFETSTVTFSKEGYAVESQKITPKQSNQTVHAVLKKKLRR